MHMALATNAGTPGKPNEDWAGATTSTIVVLDGVTVPADLGTGCTHGTPWYVRQLGARLLAAADTQPVTPLVDLLADAITAVADLHRDTCDLEHLGSPSAAVAVLRDTGTTLDYLILADVSIVIDGPNGVEGFTDRRVEEVLRRTTDGTSKDMQAGIVERRRHWRNRPGGYWVAEATPDVAAHAIAGTIPSNGVRRAAVLTDGAACLVDQYHLTDWGGALDLLDQAGPEELIRRVRHAELEDPYMVRWPRYKPGDDATAAFRRFGMAA